MSLRILERWKNLTTIPVMLPTRGLAIEDKQQETAAPSLSGGNYQNAIMRPHVIAVSQQASDIPPKTAS
jgi:hypothetical protein